MADTPPARQTLPPGRHPPGQTPPPRDGYCSGRYVSYWNAFLLISASISGRLDSVDWVTGLSAAVNIFCAFLNLIRGMAIISHGHYDVSTHSHENQYTLNFSVNKIIADILITCNNSDVFKDTDSGAYRFGTCFLTASLLSVYQVSKLFTKSLCKMY